MSKCPLKGQECRHCSQERRVTIQRVGVIKTGQLERIVSKIDLGERCNNDGRHYVKDLKECPSDLALGIKITPEMYQLSELEWSKRRS